MKTGTPSFSRPERFLILLARGEDECRGRAVRISDSAELRFSNLEQLTAWMKEVAPHEDASLTTAATEDVEDV